MPPGARRPRRTDHPRGCGEHAKASQDYRPLKGSSPRMRGTPAGRRNHHRQPRIIPADAGNTSSDANTVSAPGDHPRGCGEHTNADRIATYGYGSSPRMRGTPLIYKQSILAVRIIPADAGNTAPLDTSRDTYKDHPRGCGEHSIARTVAMMFKGSSPRMRGTHNWSAVNLNDPRIIPADAGNTGKGESRARTSRDHPRGCGEHHLKQTADQPNPGSSPRMRGTPLIGLVLVGLTRIIPADAGNTGSCPLAGLWTWDHPRGCGEHGGVCDSHSFDRGSSPRMRGTPGLWGMFNHTGRIIPADAGNTR